MNFFKKTTVYLLIVCILAFAINTPAYASGIRYSGRDDFIWGMSIHNNGYTAYKQDPEVYIKASAEMGVKLIRINCDVVGENFDYLDRIVALCSSYGLKLILCLGLTSDLDGNTEYYETIASRYDGKSGHGFIDYIEIGGEEENRFLIEGNGDSLSHYDMSGIMTLHKEFESAIKGVKNSGSPTKTIIDFSHLHYAPLLYMYGRGLDFDVIGIDWYTNMGALSKVLEPVLNKFPHEIIITESNLWNNETTNHENPEEWSQLIEFMDLAYNTSRVKGLCFYELMDEPAIETGGGFDKEAHFGFLYTNSDGSIRGIKPIYTKIKGYLGEGAVSPEPILPKKDIEVLDLEGVRGKFADNANSTFSSVSSTFSKENAGLADFSQKEHIELDVKIGDIEGLKSIVNSNALKLNFKLTSSDSINKNTAYISFDIDDLVSTGNNWYHLKVEKDKFEYEPNNNIDWSSVKSWKFFITGGENLKVGSIYSMDFCIRNICATVDVPELPDGVIAVIDENGMICSLGENWNHLCDKSKKSISAVNITNAEYLEFDVLFSDYEALKNALTKNSLRLSLNITSSNKQWQYRTRADDILSYITNSKNGWHHIKIPMSSLENRENSGADLSAINYWFIGVEGSSSTLGSSTGSLSSITLNIKNICGTVAAPRLPENTLSVIDELGCSNSLGDGAFSNVYGRINGFLETPVDLTKLEYIEFDVKYSDYAALVKANNAMGSRMAIFFGSNGDFNGGYRGDGFFSNFKFETSLGNGWYHYQIPRTAFDMSADWSAINVWYITFLGGNSGKTTGELSGLTITVRNICGTGLIPEISPDAVVVIDEAGCSSSLGDGAFSNVYGRINGFLDTPVDLSKSEYIEFDVKYSDYDALVNANNAMGSRMAIFFGSNGDFNGGYRGDGFFSNFKFETSLGNGWYHYQIPRTAFDMSADWSAINVWYITFLGGNSEKTTGDLSGLTITVRNICGTGLIPDISANEVAVIDETGCSNTLGNGAFSDLYGRVYGFLDTPVDLSKSEYIEFDVKYSDYDALVNANNAMGSRMAIFFGSNSDFNGGYRGDGFFSNSKFETSLGNGWYHYQIPRTDFDMSANWSSINVWFINIIGGSCGSSTGDLSELTITVRNICGTVESLISDTYSITDGFVNVAANTDVRTFNKGFVINSTVYGTAGVVTDGCVATGMTAELVIDGIVYDSATIIVNNDISKDGLIDALDLIMLRKNLLGLESLDSIQNYALTGAVDVQPDIRNLVKMKKVAVS